MLSFCRFFPTLMSLNHIFTSFGFPGLPIPKDLQRGTRLQLYRPTKERQKITFNRLQSLQNFTLI